MSDHVHPTAFGQIAIAERVVERDGGTGMTVFVRPSDLVTYETTRTGRLRGDLTYAYRHAKVSARDAAHSPPHRAAVVLTGARARAVVLTGGIGGLRSTARAGRLA